jgi:hypothetical protein
MLSGRASDQFEKRLLELSAISREAKIESNFYHLCAKLIGNKELKEALFRLKALPANMNDQQVGEVIKLLTQLRDDLKALDVARKDYESRLMPTVKL